MDGINDPWKAAARPAAQEGINDPWKTTTATAPATAPQSAQPTGFVDSAVQGFKRALPETKSLLAGATAAAAGAVGADRVRDAALGYYRDVQKNEVEPLANQASFVRSLKGDASLGQWAGDTLGNFAGQALQSVAAAGAGAALGSVVPGAGTAGGAVSGLVARPLIRKLVGKEVTKLVAEDAAKKTVGRSLLRRAGMVAAPTALNIAQETGIGYTGRADDAAAAGEQLDNGDALRAIAAGVPAGLLDTAAEALVAGRFLHGAGQSPNMVRRVLGGAAKGAATEGATEGAQAVLERAGAGQRLTGADAYTDYIENVAAGALGGGVPGAASGVRRPRLMVDPATGQTSAVPNPADGPISRAASAAADTGAVATVEASPVRPADAGSASRLLDGSDVITRATGNRLIERGYTREQVLNMTQKQGEALLKAPPAAQVDTDTGEILVPAGEAGKPGRTSRWLDDAGVPRNPTDDELGAFMHETLDAMGSPASGNRGKIFDAARAEDGALKPPQLNRVWNQVWQERKQALLQAEDGEQATVPARAEPIAGLAQEPTLGGLQDGQADAVEGSRLADAVPAGSGDALAAAGVPADGAQAEDLTSARAGALRDSSGDAVKKAPAAPLVSSSRRIEAPQPAQGSPVPGASAEPVPAVPGPAASRAQEDQEQVAQAVQSESASSPSPQSAPADSRSQPVSNVDLQRGDRAAVPPTEQRKPWEQTADEWVSETRAALERDHAEGVVRIQNLKERIAENQEALQGRLKKADRQALEQQVQADKVEVGALESRLPPDDPAHDITPERHARIVQLARARGDLSDASVPPGGSAVSMAAAEAATSPKNDRPEPTDAQKEAGNYKKGHVLVGGLDVSIENEAGTSRRPEWPPLKHHYGYIKGSVGADKDHVDVFLTENAEDTSRPVFVVDQYDKGKFDEHKVVLGAATEEEARAAYLANYSPDFQQQNGARVRRGAGAITQMSQDEFKAWVRDQEATKRPAGAPPQSARAAAADAVAAIVARIAGGEAIPEALAGADDATARAVAGQLGHRFSKTAPAAAIAKNLGARPQEDLRRAARRSAEVASMGAQPAGRPGPTLDGAMWDAMSEGERNFLFYEPSWRTASGRNVQEKAKGYLGLSWDRLTPDVQSKLVAAYELREAAHGRRPAAATEPAARDSIPTSGAQEVRPTSEAAPSTAKSPGNDAGAIVKQIAGGAHVEKALNGAGDATAREVAAQLGHRFSKTAKARAIAANLGAKSQPDLRKAARRATEAARPPAAAAQDNTAGERAAARPAAAPSAKLDDFGEKLEGARKFLPPSLREALTDEQIASQPLSKLWPADAHMAIENDVAAALAFAARAEVPAKPRKAPLVARWAEQVKLLRKLPENLENAGSMDALEEWAKRLGLRLDGFFAKVRLLAQLPREHWGRVGKVGEHPYARRSRSDAELAELGLTRRKLDEAKPYLGYGLFRGYSDTPLSAEQRDEAMFVPDPHSSVQVDGKSHEIPGGKLDQDAVQQVRALLGDAPARKTTLSATDFEVFTYRNRPETFIRRKGDSENRHLKTFAGGDGAAQARAFLKDPANLDALAAEWEKVKARDNVGKADTRRDANRPRVGESRRQGQDVTEQMFSDAFGFRGVQFGNWVGQGKGAKDRQGLLNESYDALLDLADVLGIPSRAISLNGTLGLSLGARGGGKASAHFERDNLVINLTKTRGAGTLAHEWFHALDNYFSRLRGSTKNNPREGDYITYKPEPAWVHQRYGAAGIRTSAALRTLLKNRGAWQDDKTLEQNAEDAGWRRDPEHKDGVRPEVERAFAVLVEALNASPMAARSATLDKGAAGYWNRIIERGARSFENYVIAKLAQRGWSNDFLANVRDWKQWADLGKNKERYPYLFPEEEAPIVQAFDSLFDTIQTRETEAGNVALFSRRGWDGAFPDAVLGHQLGVVQAHPDYAAGKSGSTAAALRLSRDLVTDDYVEAIRAALPPGAKPVVVPVLAAEAGGNNRIPQTTAHVLASKLGLKVEDGIVQASKVNRGGADGVSRLGRQPKFEGAVMPGQEYLLLDDTLTQGGTLAQLKTHIEDAGGKVLLVSALTGKDYSRKIALSPETLGRLRDRFGSIENWWRDTFGYGFEGFTESEAAYLLKLRGDPTPESIRDRVVAGGLPEVRGVHRSRAGEQGVVRGLAFDQAQALKQQLTSNWGRNAPRVVLVADSSELASAARGAGVNLSAADVDRVEGMYLGKPTVWLNLSEIRTAERFREVLTHEALGHYGVEHVIGRDEWRSITKAIDQHVQNGTGAPDVRAAIAQLRRTQPDIFDNPETVAKEVIAVMAEKGSRNGLVQRAITAVRRFLRRIMPGQRWTDADIRGLLHEADRFLRAGRSNEQAQAAVRAMAFSQRAGAFYSAFLESVHAAKGAPKRGTAEQWTGWLDGAQRRGEFKQAERDWLGVDDWLAQQDGPVSREALADYVRANAVQVQDVVLGGAGTQDLGALPDGWETERQPNGEWFVLDGDGEVMGEGATEADAIQNAQDADERADAVAGGAAKFASYQLPGGENYRELLLTMPPAPNSLVPNLRAQQRPDGNWEVVRRDGDLIKAFRTEEEANVYVRNNAMMGEVQSPRFTSSHFDEPNILAHVRFNERTGADGKRVLFLEEVQSDWHQQGRKRGYGRKWVVRYGNEQIDSPAGVYPTEDEARTKTAELNSAIPDDNYGYDYKEEIGTPDAPFRGTDEWAMLAFKRMVRWAAENGFDRIAWTTGEQQAERYNLSKQISRVYFDDNSSGGIGRPKMEGEAGRGMLHAYDLRGKEVISRSVEPSQVEDYVGKEIAERLFASTAQEARTAGMGVRRRELSGLDLKVGGEGMRGFYDKILPSAVNKWAKRFGGRVGLASIPSYDKGTGRKHLFDTAEVHAIDLTPAMREAAMAGQPLFSRAPGESIDAMETAIREINGEVEGGSTPLERVKRWLKDATPKQLKERFRSTWLGALATSHLTELGSDYFPTMGIYSDYLAEMGAARNQLQQEGEEVAEDARKWAGKNKAEAATLFELMHDATILGVDPAEEYKPLQYRMSGKMHDVTPKNIREALKVLREVMRGRAGDDKRAMIEEGKSLRAMLKAEPKRRATYPTLVARWNQLSPEAQAHYRAMRDLYAKRHDQTEAALIQRINDLKIEGGEKRKAVLINMIRQQFEAQRLQGVYFPLQRFGKYFVAAERGESSTFLMFESQPELERAVKGLRARGFTVTAQGLKGEGKAKDAPSGTFVAEVIEKLRASGVSDRTQDEIYQMYLHALPELSMRKHKIHRKSVPGWDPDALRAFAFNMAHGAHQLARLRYAHKLSDTIDVLQAQQDAKRREEDADTARIVAGDAILEELRKRHEWISNPQDSKLTNLVSSFGFVYYLGLTPAASLVNLTQTPLITYPYLAAKFGGVKAMNALLAAGRDAARTVGNIQRTLTDPEEQRAHQVLQQMGALDKTQAHNLMGIAEGGLSGHNPAWAKAMEVIGWGFHKTEVINREATGLAAFRLAKEAGQSFDEAVKTAAKTINETHYDYTNANRARFMQSGTAKVLLMFRQYSLNTTWHLARMVWNATRGADPEVKRIARRNLTGILGMSALFSGALGLPLASVVMGVLNSVAASAGDDDEPWDAETEFRKFLVDMLGEGPARVVLGGVANEVTGADIAGRVSFSQLWFRDADRELDGRGTYYNLLEQAAGPMGGVLKNALVGKQLMDEGHLMRGVETVLPKALKDGLKSLRYTTEGVNNLRGDAILPDLSVRQLLLQVGGFTPAEVADRYDRNRALKNYEQHVTDRRLRLVDAFALATRTQDMPGRVAVMEQIRAFNLKWPEIRITPRTLRMSMRARARYSAQAESGIVLNKKIASRVREAVGGES